MKTTLMFLLNYRIKRWCLICKEMYFDEKALSNKCTRDKTLIRLHKSSAIIAGFLKKKLFSKPIESETRILSSHPKELCDRLKLLLQKKQARNISYIMIEETVAIRDKLLEYKCISTIQDSFLLYNCLN